MGISNSLGDHQYKYTKVWKNCNISPSACLGMKRWCCCRRTKAVPSSTVTAIATATTKVAETSGSGHRQFSFAHSHPSFGQRLNLHGNAMSEKKSIFY